MLFTNKTSGSKNSNKNISGLLNSSSHLFYLDNLSVSFGNVKVLKNIQLTVGHGEILFLTGPSGAGKTTLINVLAGEIEHYTGRCIRPNSENYFVTCVHQDMKMIDSLSCEKNLFMSYDSSVYRSKNEFVSEMLELSHFLGIKDKLGMKFSKANGGLKNKLAVLRAVLSRPEVLLADEPTSALDRSNAQRVYELLQFYNERRKTTIIWASHNKELVKQFPGRIVHIDQGKIFYSGHACFI